MKNIFKIIISFTLVNVLFTLISCNNDDQNSLSVSPANIVFDKDGGSANISIQTDADFWFTDNPANDWVELSKEGGSEKSISITLTVNTSTAVERMATITVSAGTAPPVKVTISQPATDFQNTVSSDPTSLNFKRTGGSSEITINTNAPQWNLSFEADWFEASQSTGGTGNTTINITASDNLGTSSRSAFITVTADEAPVYKISVSQDGGLYPGYNISPAEPDATGMSSTAEELASEINLGWNIGNSLEAIGGETAWGNPAVSKALIDMVKQNGFNAIRIPAAWDQYMVNSSTAELQATWLNRVKDVVQYCIDNDMYVVLNIHWDGGWLENNVTVNKKDANNEKQKAFWEQIATHLRDFDEHLLFASANEPNVDNATQMDVLTSYHQTFIDAVRATGGKNSYRTLVVQGPSTDIEKTNNLMNTLPTDVVEDRMMVEIHYYTPWNFCGLTEDASWGKMFYYWGDGYHSATDTERNATWGEEDVVDNNFNLMKTKFVDNGIPVVLGEYDATRRSALTGNALTEHLASRAYYLNYVTKQALAYGLLPFYWDNGGMDNHSSGIFNRNNNTVFDQMALDALVEGATE